MLLLLVGTFLLMQVPRSYLSMVHTNEMLGEIIGKVLLSWVPLHIEISHLDLICHPKELHFHQIWSAILDSVVRYTTSVGGCLWPISSRVNLRTLPSLQLRNKAPNSASAADATRGYTESLATN